MKYQAKKSLGQNFLKSIVALNKIVEVGEVGESDTILEIGPGRGALTAKLLEHANKVIAIEKDYELFLILQDKFSLQIKSGSLVLVHDDILKFNPKDFNLKSGIYKLIANIPYNITGAILKKFLSETRQPSTMVLMVQYEVAKRILARDHKESLLSLGVKAYGTPKFVMKVQKRYFSPEPKVDSAVIAIKNISNKIFVENKINEENFWSLIRAGFAHKRKILIGNLRIFDKKTNWETIFNEIKHKKTARAEDFALEDWVLLTKLYNSHLSSR